VAVVVGFPSSPDLRLVLTLGPEAEPEEAPGTMPKLAFQRAKLSSSASSFAYSSKLLAAVSLNPVELSMRFCPSLVAGDDYGTWGSGWGQIIFMRGLDRRGVSPRYVCIRVGGDVRSCFGRSGSLSVVIVSMKRDVTGQGNNTCTLSPPFIDNGNYRIGDSHVE